MRSGCLVVVLRKGAPDHWGCAEDIKVIAGNHLAADAISLAMPGGRKTQLRSRQDAVKHRAATISKIAISGIGKADGVTVIGVHPSRPRTFGLQEHEPLGIAN